jgi:hypothetical protein
MLIAADTLLGGKDTHTRLAGRVGHEDPLASIRRTSTATIRDPGTGRKLPTRSGC